MKPQLDMVMCTACHACVSVCPNTCIVMKEDALGFLRPSIDEGSCIGCGLCEKACRAVKKIPACPDCHIYAVRHKSNDVVKRSASGGVFTALSDVVLQMGGVIVGARYMEDMAVKHVIARTAEERDELCGSKYTYSLCDKTLFVQIQEILQQGIAVLFSGTPCQAAALKVFLDKEYDHLYIADILCHGIAAPVFYRDYVSALENKNGKVAHIDFRYAPNGNWHDPKTCVTYHNGKAKRGELENSYFRIFVRNYCLRESCYSCDYANFDRVSDITLGDFWGIEKRRPELDAPDGVSVVVVNTIKGRSLFEQADEMLCVEPCCREDCLHDQLNGLKPANRNELFVEEYGKYGFEYVRKKYVTTPATIRMRERLYQVKAIRCLRDKLKKIRNVAKRG